MNKSVTSKPHRECKECTLCCTLLGIRQLNKPAYKTCQHCTDGCSIHSIRPTECIEFDCAWLQGIVPLELKPSKTHVVLTDLGSETKKQGHEIADEQRRIFTVHIDPNFPHAYKEGEMKRYLNWLLAQGIELLIARKGEPVLQMKWGMIDDDKGE